MTQILIVEDSRTQAEALRFALESEGFQVQHAPDGLRALGPTAVTLSDMEGLDAHGNAVKVRLEKLGASR